MAVIDEATVRMAMQRVGAGFHPDDDPRTYRDANGQPVFTEAEARKVADALDALADAGTLWDFCDDEATALPGRAS